MTTEPAPVSEPLVVVPREPSENHFQAAMDAVNPIGCCAMDLSDARAFHRAMLAASPDVGARPIAAEGLDIPALASAIHDARYHRGRDDTNWTPFGDEYEVGKIYCIRIANAVALHLAALPTPQTEPLSPEGVRARELLATENDRMGFTGYARWLRAGMPDSDDSPGEPTDALNVISALLSRQSPSEGQEAVLRALLAEGVKPMGTAERFEWSQRVKEVIDPQALKQAGGDQ